MAGDGRALINGNRTYNKAELIVALRQLTSNALSEQAEDALIADISANVRDPGWMNHIYQTNAYTDPNGVVDLAAVSDKILSYQAIQL